MNRSTVWQKFIPVAFAVPLVVSLACNLGAQPAPPTVSPSPAPTDTRPPPTLTPTAALPAPVPPGEAATRNDVTGPDGETAFADPLSGRTLTVRVQDGATGEPLPGLQIWFASNGPQVLITAYDPGRIYLPGLLEVHYRDLGETATVNLPLTQLQAIGGSLEAWYTHFQTVPDPGAWATGSTVQCEPPPEAQPGMGGGFEDLVLMANPGEQAAMTLRALEYVAAPGDLAQALLAAGDTSPVGTRFRGQPPALVRWETLDLPGDVPSFSRPLGFCLPPLDRSERQAVLDWVRYGLENGEMFVYETLAWEEGVGYANYIEGGQPNDRETFLAALQARLPGDISCEGYSFSDPWFQIWTSGWEPDWEISELCYVDCQPVEPPYQSDIAAFFLRLQEGQWVLQTMWLNDASLWVDVYGAQVVGCDQPVD